MRAFLILLLCLVPGTLDAQEIKCKHFFQGMPSVDTTPSEIIIRDCYALQTNRETKFPAWVAYRLTLREVCGTLDLGRKWRTDPWLAADATLETNRDDYRGAATLLYDRGHLVPLASFKGSLNASQVNYYSVIAPQRRALNRGPWLDLENAVRDLVWSEGSVYVIVGPLYEKKMAPLPNADEPHRVPSGFWMIVAAPTGVNIEYDSGTGNYSNGTQAVGFIVSQVPGLYNSIRDFIVPIQEIEARAAIQVFPNMDEVEAARVKGSVSWYWIDDTFLEGDYYVEE